MCCLPCKIIHGALTASTKWRSHWTAPISHAATAPASQFLCLTPGALHPVFALRVCDTRPESRDHQSVVAREQGLCAEHLHKKLASWLTVGRRGRSPFSPFLPLPSASLFILRIRALSSWFARLDTTHSEFADALVPDAKREVENLWNGYDGGAVAANTDAQGHGTHCGGTIGGLTVGAAPGASVYGVKVLDDDGSGYTSVIVAGLEYVVDWLEAARADGGGAAYAVASLSLGGSCSLSGCTGDALVAVVDAAAAAGVAVTVAAGNDDADACDSTPAASTRALTIGATDSADERASFSNFGACVDLHAPGVAITSAVAGDAAGFVAWSGTSMATPHVAGALAIELALTTEDNSGDAAAEAARARLLARAAANDVVELGDLAGSPRLLLMVDIGNDGSANPSLSPSPTITPTSAPSAPTARPTTCDDTDGGATDPYDDGCVEYIGYPSWCGNYDDDDFTSTEMCCACGGGARGSATPSVSAAPTRFPTTQGPSVTREPTTVAACEDSCYGQSCDYWSNPCEELESAYGCNCDGCSCDDGGGYGYGGGGYGYGGGCEDSCYGQPCDYWSSPCEELETSYGCDCSGCACDHGGGGSDDDDDGHNDDCSDTDNGAYDIYGPPYNCASYVGHSAWCGNYDDSDFSSNEMCCVCGGGSRGSAAPSVSAAPTLFPTYEPTQRPSVTHAPTVVATCEDSCYGQSCDYWSNPCAELESAYGCNCDGCSCDDDDGHNDGCSDTDDGATGPYGDGCAAYTDHPAWCGNYDEHEFSSNEMCCVCGGGSHGSAAPSISPAPTLFPTYEPTQRPSVTNAPTTVATCEDSCYGQSCDYWSNPCEELETSYGCNCSGCACDDDNGHNDDCSDTDDGATDPYGDGCAAYTDYAVWCGNYDDSDFSSNEMCCVCGGGSRGSAAPSVSAAPTLFPTYEPTQRPSVTHAPTATTSCEDSCYEQSCDYWSNPCEELETSYGCDCSGCSCKDESSNDDDGEDNDGCTNTDNDAVDPYSDGCEEYVETPSWCGKYDGTGFSSNEMCCACGGGRDRGNKTNSDNSTTNSSSTNGTSANATINSSFNLTGNASNDTSAGSYNGSLGCAVSFHSFESVPCGAGWTCLESSSVYAEDGALYVTNQDGSDAGNYIRKDRIIDLAPPDSDVLTVDFHVEKDDSCDDHFVYLSTSASQDWSWSSTAGAVKFAWDCGGLTIYGQSSSTYARYVSLLLSRALAVERVWSTSQSHDI